MTKRILDVDPFTGIRTVFDYDHSTDTTYVGYEDAWDTTGKVLEWNKARAKDVDKSKATAKRDFLHYARIPPMAQLDMLQKHGVKVWDRTHRRKMMALLNSSEYEDCRLSHVKHDR